MMESGLDGGVAAPEGLIDRDDPGIRLAAWGVHLYTAIGLMLAAWIAVLLVDGGPDAFRLSFFLLVVASLVDATDGTLARKVRVKEVLPGFDGRKLDDIIDFLTYTSLPLLLIWRAGLLPGGGGAWLLLPLLASIYGFCQVEAKTDDGYFLGFPSLWNVVAYYLYALQLPHWAAVAVIVALSLMTFVPSRYLYPSLPGRLNAFSNILGVPWIVMLAVILWLMPTGVAPRVGDSTWWLAVASLYFPAFYMVASWAVTIRFWRARSDQD